MLRDLFDADVSKISGSEPTFDVLFANVTVVVGETAVLPCSVENLGRYKVRHEYFCSILAYN